MYASPCYRQKHARCVAATDKNDQKTKNLKHKPNYIHTTMYIVQLYTVVINTKKNTKIQNVYLNN